MACGDALCHGFPTTLALLPGVLSSQNIIRYFSPRGLIFPKDALILGSLPQGVVKQRVGRQRLAAVLRAEAEQVDATLAQSDLHERGLPLEFFPAEEPAR